MAVSLNLSQTICEAAPKHVANAACCSGKASPVWNASTTKCDTTCDSSNPCDYQTCTALSQCHAVGVCDPQTALCSNPTRPNGTSCSDANSCTVGDACTNGTCVGGAAVASCCGNGVVEAGEQCDDGNQSGEPSDGCGAGCVVDATWVCTGQPSSCCLGVDVVRFSLPELNQNQCESIKAAPDAGCCQGSHKGVWTGTTCNVQCSVDKCNPASGWGSPADYGCYSTPCVVTGPCDPNDGCARTQAPAGSTCGSGATACSAQDTCDAAGQCQPNHHPDGGTCAWPSECAISLCEGGACVDASDVLNGQSCDDGDLCTVFDGCVSGACVGSTPPVCLPGGECHLPPQCDPQIGCHTPPAPAGTPCGIAEPQNPCRLGSTCDGNGGCEPNFVPDGTACGGSDGSCFTSGTCSSGTCSGGAVPLERATPCGDVTPLGDCDGGDTCDEAGNCLPNALDAVTVCRADTGPCDVEERCDGTSPSCPADAHEPAGTACGDPISVSCSGPDRCDEAGTCQPCAPTTTTTVAPATTTTTLGTQEPCAGIVGIARARCLIDDALAGALCADPIPAKVDRALRARLKAAAGRLAAAAAGDGRKRVRALRRAGAALAAAGRKSAAGAKSKKAERRISASCAGEIGALVNAARADVS